MKALIICIGNEARGDDGIAHRVGNRLRERGYAVLSAPQLDPIWAMDLAEADRAVFVDAHRRTEPPVLMEALAPSPLELSGTSHALTPEALVALAGALYGNAPHAWLVSIAAPEMGHGDELSVVASAASDRATADIIALLG